MNIANVAQLAYAEESTKIEISTFINEGLKDVQNEDVYDFDEVIYATRAEYGKRIESWV